MGGFGAILLWSMTVALVRSLSERLGPLTAATAVYAISGALGLGALLLRGRWRPLLERGSRRYLVGCGSLFVAYMLFFFLAVGKATGREQVLELGLLNYLWPVLTLLGAVVLLGRKARWSLWPGIVLALAGMWLVLAQGGGASWSSLLGHVAQAPVAYACGALAAISWALYSVLARRWGGAAGGGAVGLFLPLTGAVLLPLSLLADEPRAWSWPVAGEALFLGVATFAAYGLWDTAMRRGNVVLVAAGSFMTPLLSTVFSCVYLSVMPGSMLWAGCGVLIAGSWLSWRSVSERPPHGLEADLEADLEARVDRR
jgi:drug/metabolite transporter (DMT)-like permease